MLWDSLQLINREAVLWKA